MYPIRIIPCLDICAGRVVKGVRFKELRDAGDPVENAKRYEDEGADELVILDVSATIEERSACFDTIAAVRRVLSIPLTAGGGLKCTDDARLMLSAGADKVTMNSAALKRPALISEVAELFGRQCAVVAMDVRRSANCSSKFETMISSGTTPTGLDALEWAGKAAVLGAGEILLTSIDRDGTGDGYDLELITAIASSVNIPVIASGGGRHPAQMAAAIRSGASAVLAASIFHFGDYAVGDVKAELSKEGICVRREYDYSID